MPFLAYFKNYYKAEKDLPQLFRNLPGSSLLTMNNVFGHDSKSFSDILLLRLVIRFSKIHFLNVYLWALREGTNEKERKRSSPLIRSSGR